MQGSATLPSHLSFKAVQLAAALVLASAAALTALPLVDALFGIFLAAVMLWLAKSDLETFELPDIGNLAVAVLGLAWIATLADPVLGLAYAALRAAVAVTCLVTVKWCYVRLREVEGLGWGDVKLAAAGAIWLGWHQLPIGLLIAAAAAILVVAGRAALDHAPLRSSAAIPFGAFLGPSIWLVWFAGRTGIF